LVSCLGSRIINLICRRWSWETKARLTVPDLILYGVARRYLQAVVQCSVCTLGGVDRQLRMTAQSTTVPGRGLSSLSSFSSLRHTGYFIPRLPTPIYIYVRMQGKRVLGHRRQTLPVRAGLRRHAAGHQAAVVPRTVRILPAQATVKLQPVCSVLIAFVLSGHFLPARGDDD
jgi:hypothetical protein